MNIDKMMCSRKFLRTLCKIAKQGKQLSCPLTEWKTKCSDLGSSDSCKDRMHLISVPLSAGSQPLGGLSVQLHRDGVLGQEKLMCDGRIRRGAASKAGSNDGRKLEKILEG